MIDKEVKIEWIKFLIRGAEIFLLAMIVAPTAAFLLKDEFSTLELASAVGVGLIGMLTFLFSAVMLWKRWKK